MFEPVTTNAAGILTIIILWCTLTWIVTYYIMSTRRNKKVQVLDDTIEFLNIYCDELHLYINDLMNKLDAESAPVSYILTDDGKFAKEGE